MSGSYLAKNTDWTRNFLRGFANYEFRLPKSFHGTDNGAIHVNINCTNMLRNYSSDSNIYSFLTLITSWKQSVPTLSQEGSPLHGV
ncbi:hypothetical protein COOONC_12055 [Cooperia oncophora]